MRAPGWVVMVTMALWGAWPASTGASTVSVEPEEPILAEAPYVTDAVVMDTTISRAKCLYTNTVTLALVDPVRGVLPTRKAVVMVLSYRPSWDGCMGVSYSTPPRASKLDKGARIIAAIRCTVRDVCIVIASWNETERARLEALLEKLGRADGHDMTCAKATAKKKAEELSIASGVDGPPTKAGIGGKWLGAGHKIDGPGMLDLSLARAGKTAKLTVLSDEYSGWKHAGEIGVCWRVVEAEDFDPKAAVLRVFVLAR